MPNKTNFIALVPVFDQRWRCCRNNIFGMQISLVIRNETRIFPLLILNLPEFY